MTDSCGTMWISPPGETIEDLLEERGWSKAELAERLGYTPKHISQLLAGRAPITPATAAALSRVLGSTTQFWLERESRYRAALDREAGVEALTEEKDWLNELPLAWMVKEGQVPRYAHKGEQVDAALRFFNVASVPAWREVYGGQGTAFRTSASFGKHPGAVAAWLRRAEIEAAAIRCAPWDGARFQKLLPALRELTLEVEPSVFVPKLVDACRSCGVAVTFVPTPPKCPASGATRWLSPQRALLILSLRHKSNDHLWFTFFHEAGHLLLHSKKLAFLEGMDGLDPALEREADQFAADLLIPPACADELPRLRSRNAILSFAERIGIPPGIVVGRLQKEGHVGWSAFNGLKQRYEWKRFAWR